MVVPYRGMSTRAWAQAVASGECVCTMPPISGKAAYSARWVGVSEDGRQRPSATWPEGATTTMSSAFIAP